MALLTLSAWVLRRLASHPAGWAWAGLLFGTWPILDRLTPLGLPSLGGGSSAVLLELAYLAGLLGAVLALVLLATGRSFLELLPPRRRFLGMATALASTAAASQVLVLLSGLLPPLECLTVGGIAGLAIADFHLGLLGACLLGLGGAARLPATLFLVLAWALPALLPSTTPGGALYTLFLDASRHLDLAAVHKCDFLSVLVHGGAVATMLAAGLLLACPPPRPR